MKKKLFLLTFCLVLPFVSHADLIQDLQQQIDAKKPALDQLKAQGVILEQQLQTTTQTKDTLNSTIKVLDTSQKKLTNDLNITEINISSTTLSINQINEKIRLQENQIIIHENAVKDAIRQMAEAENKSTMLTLLESGTISDVWKDIDALGTLQKSLRENIIFLKQDNIDLATQEKRKENNKVVLINLQQDLSIQKQSVDVTKKSKADLLAATKNQEAIYQQLLANNRAQEKQFEDDLYNYESQLRITIDPSLYPLKKPGVLSWPINPIFQKAPSAATGYISVSFPTITCGDTSILPCVMIVTQKFGKTVGASRLYESGSHNGIDFRATVGTPVKAVLSGTIAGAGNTDEERGCYSYGRWILIKHDNGLSSIYGHLSASRVTVGQRVNTGDVIGLSGGAPGMYGSGYSTGQHLHLGLFATQGVQIKQFIQSHGCKQEFLPIADAAAYLDPLAYLPSI